MCNWPVRPLPCPGSAVDGCLCLQCIHDAFVQFCRVKECCVKGRTAEAYTVIDDNVFWTISIMPRSLHGAIDEVAIYEVHNDSRIDSIWVRGLYVNDSPQRFMDDVFQPILQQTSKRRAAVAKALPLDDADVVRMIAHAL
jgi:hypothetical protein